MADGVPLLEVEAIETCYGLSQVLFGMSLSVRSGEMVALMGRNGMGKTTTIRSILGLTPARAGAIRFAGHEVRKLPSFRIAQLGIGLVPEGRQIFPNLTVRENLVAASGNRLGVADPWTIEKIHALFPRLAERRRNLGRQLSGGEQQMLAIGRTLMTNPDLLLLDEPLEGLAPVIVKEIASRIRQLMSEEGLTIILVEQHTRFALALTEQVIVLERGRIIHSGESRALLDDVAALDRLVGMRRLRDHAPTHDAG